jgi:glycosyltransferase involved in cell wall biosynthesis
MAKISAVIITFNEEKCIERCINSVRTVADEIVVLDSFSTDRTGEICKKLAIRFFQHKFYGYRDQKNLATQHAQFDYILSLDADEALSKELEESILKVRQDWKYDGYKFNRLNNFCGQWIHHSDWYPDCKIRLFDRRKGEWGGRNIHETVIMHKGASVGFLMGNLLHWTPPLYEQHIEKGNKFSSLIAQEYFKSGKKVSILKIIFSPAWCFIRSYFFRLGFLDGYNGFVISNFFAYTNFQKYIKLRQLHFNEKKRRTGNTGKISRKKHISQIP